MVVNAIDTQLMLIQPAWLQMFSRAAVRATTQVAGRRGFHATRSQMSSPYHYAEGPYTNIPFNPKKKTFPILFWGYCATGFSAPFLIAGASCSSVVAVIHVCVRDLLTFLQPGKPTSPVHRREKPTWYCDGGLAHNDGEVALRLVRRVYGARIEPTIDNFSNRVSLSSDLGRPSRAPRSSMG